MEEIELKGLYKIDLSEIIRKVEKYRSHNKINLQFKISFKYESKLADKLIIDKFFVENIKNNKLPIHKNQIKCFSEK